MALMTNLVRAEMAVAYVDSVMKWPSSNKPEDIKHREMYGMPIINLKSMRSEFNEFSASHGLDHGHGYIQGNVDYFLAYADFAQKHGVGLCDELTAVAFKWLTNVRAVPCNVSFYSISDTGIAFHSFIILGEREPPRMRYFLDEKHSPATWPMDAVWCDPWRRDWFEIKDDWRRRVSMVAHDCGHKFESPLGYFSVRCMAFSSASDRSPWRHV